MMFFEIGEWDVAVAFTTVTESEKSTQLSIIWLLRPKSKIWKNKSFLISPRIITAKYEGICSKNVGGDRF